MNTKSSQPLSLYQKLLDDDQRPGHHFVNILIRTLMTLLSGSQYVEAKVLFNKYLHSNDLQHFAKLALISWYLENLEASEEELHDLRLQIDQLWNDIGATPSAKELKNEILNLKSIDQDSNRDYVTLQISLKHKTEDEMISAFRSYLSCDPIPFYKRLARQALDKLLCSRGENENLIGKLLF